MYALGVVLYELLTGKKPFLAENLEALLDKIVKLEPLPPCEVRSDLPRSLDSVILRALKKSPEQRYANFTELALELSRVGQTVLPEGSIPDSEKYVVLKSVPMLATLADSELWELARAGKWRRLAKTRAIIREKEKGASFFFLASGQAKVTLAGRLLNMVNGGECFGEMSWITGGEQPRHATVESMTDCLLAEFEPPALDRMSVGAQLQLTRALVRNVSERLALANTRIAK
jgi:eukaryotic-like serine/threonine-protein kinase